MSDRWGRPLGDDDYGKDPNEKKDEAEKPKREKPAA